MAQSSVGSESAVEGTVLTEVDAPKVSLLDSIFGESQPRPVERRRVPRAQAPVEAPRVEPARVAPARLDNFVPAAPKSLEDAGLSETEVNDLILKFLFRRGVQSGRAIAEQLRLPFAILQSTFQAMKNSQLIVIAKNSSVSDFEYSITGKGIEAAKQ